MNIYHKFGITWHIGFGEEDQNVKSLKNDSDDEDRHKVMTIPLHDHLGQVRKKRFPLYNSLKKY